MPKELVTERRDHDRNEPISGVVVQWGPWQEMVQIGATLDVRPVPEKREYIFASLNSRASVNDLIRYLRKARDQAFGADE